MNFTSNQEIRSPEAHASIIKRSRELYNAMNALRNSITISRQEAYDRYMQASEKARMVVQSAGVPAVEAPVINTPPPAVADAHEFALPADQIELSVEAQGQQDMARQANDALKEIYNEQA
jgi:hypothetical protein